ncbi:hypothetical protein [Pedobacter sp. SYSU D00535]|uniref:hypothetical protein n=1 Tax=Pedobacter sp. SYSU D00535 TaxID=2810308 RepID=UPI001A97933E|nr:hypothetical protein [Pedobacter sp. SYSU D00535]
MKLSNSLYLKNPEDLLGLTATDFLSDVLFSDKADISTFLSDQPQPDPDDEEEEEDDSFERTYGDLEDGHNDLATPDSDTGVDNLE